MRYWWVSHKKTHKQELSGGYLWSPKTKNDGSRNPYYEFMKEVAPGDLVLSYANQVIMAIGKARSIAYESKKPDEFGSAGDAWSTIGWRVDVDFDLLSEPRLSPATIIDSIRELLPTEHSPIRVQDGKGKELYLTSIPSDLAERIIELIGTEAKSVAARLVTKPVLDTTPEDSLEAVDAQELERIGSSTLSSTEKEALVKARRGQGLFRDELLRLEGRCRISGVSVASLLRASHIKPWRVCSNEERLDPHNGLMLCPNADIAFDKGLISFGDDGEIIPSAIVDKETLVSLGIDPDKNVGPFSEPTKAYLKYHRDFILRRAKLTNR